jgi:hypothetical protein
MSFTQRKFSKIGLDYTIDCVVLEKISTICDLGVTLDEGFSFNRHIDSVMVSKTFGKLGFIRRCAAEFHDPYTL